MPRLVRPRYIVPAALLVAVAAGGVYLYAGQTMASAHYQTSPAILGTVTQTLSLSGNLTPISQVDLDFGVAGKVTAVSVQPGQAVNAGDPIASLDSTSLQGALTQAQANLAAAQAKVSLDQAGPTAQNLAQAQASVSTASVGLQNAKTSLADTQAANAQSVTQAENAIPPAQSQVNTDTGIVATDTTNLRNAQQTETNDNCGSSSPGANCPQDEQAVQQDQQTLATDTQTLAKDRAALTSAQSSLAQAQVKAQQSNDQAQAQVGTAQVQLSNAQAALTALQQGTTTQQLTMDASQVAVDQVNVAAAQRNLNQAAMVAPVSGTVSAVNITSGQTVTAASSSTHAVSIISPGAYAVTGAVSDAQIGEVAMGQLARVTPAGATQALTGKVTAIAAVATVTSGVATFPVTVTIDGDNPGLHAGVSASVSVIISQISQVITVPTGAIRSSGAGSTVQVLVNGKPQTRAVQLGATDPTRTQVLSGIAEGDLVVVGTSSSTGGGTRGNGNTRGGGGRGGGGPGGFGGGFGGG